MVVLMVDTMAEPKAHLMAGKMAVLLVELREMPTVAKTAV